MDIRRIKIIFFFTFAALLFSCTEYTWAITSSETAKLLASDGAMNDQFGTSISVDGDTAVIGAPLEDDGGTDSGSAYVFVRNPIDGIWAEQEKLTALDAATGDKFGSSVSVSGDTAVVSAHQSDDFGSNSGSTYVFVRNPIDETWTQQTKLTASDAAISDAFGISVSVNNNTAVIGAFSDDDGGTNSGSAYVFVRNPSDGIWTQKAKLTASDGAARDLFGRTVTVSGDTAVVGANQDDDAGKNSGSAYVFVRNPIDETWTQQTKLTASDAATGDNFGISVSVSGDTSVIGSYLNGEAGSLQSGSAYIYVRSGNAWSEQAKLTADDAAGSDLFGFSVSVSGDTAVVGAYQDDDAGSDSGSAYVFNRSGSIWSQQIKFVASDAIGDDNFGFSVSASGSTAVVGAHKADSIGGSDSGSAYVFSFPEPPIADTGTDHDIYLGEIVQLDGSGSSATNGTIVSYTWEIVSAPDFSVSALSDPNIVNPTLTPDLTGQYIISLVVNDGILDSIADTILVNVSSNLPPVAVASGIPTTGDTPLTADFDASGSSDPETGSLTFDWNFGDPASGASNTSTQASTTHLYNNVGTYMAVVTVTDSFGNTDQASVEIAVTASNMPPTVAPIATINDFTVEFTANANDPEGELLTYEWDFGDGTPVSTDINPTHIYNVPGTYTVTATVSDGELTVQGTATVSIFSPFNVDVYSAMVISGKRGKVKSKISLKSCFTYDGIPLQSDMIKVKFDGITLFEVPFASFKERADKPGIFKYVNKNIRAKINFNNSRIKVFRHKILLSGLDNSNGVDVIISFGSSNGSDNIIMKKIRMRRRCGYDDSSSDDRHKIKLFYKKKHRGYNCNN